MKMLPFMEVRLPDNLTDVAEKHKEIMKMAVLLGSGTSLIPMTNDFSGEYWTASWAKGVIIT